MKARYLLISFALGLVSMLGVLWFLSGGLLEVQAQGPDGYSIYYVAPGGNCGDGFIPCYDSVQAAVSDADDSDDVIKVATGIYTDIYRIRLVGGEYVTQVVHLENTVTIQGGYTTTNWSTSDPNANPTTLDAGGQGRVFYVEAGVAPTIMGLRIVGGNANRGDTDRARRGRGGGVYAGAMITFTNNHVSGNTASLGGGLYLRENNVVFIGNTVTANTAGYGGGLFLNRSSVDLNGNMISANVAISNGGGLLLFRSDDVTFNGDTVISNTAASGGGMYLDDSDATLTNNVIADNSVGAEGGGLYIRASSPHLFHTAIAHNSGNSGVYVTFNSNVEMVNTILVSHTVGVSVTGDGAASLNATLWHANTLDWSGNVVHTNDRSGDPDFVPNAGDYHIGNLSAAIDQGVDAGISQDIDGDMRPRGHGYDIGPDEYPDLLSVVKLASPTPAQAGEQLVYTIRIVNFGNVTLTAAITDILPDHVTFTGVITNWTSQTVYPDPENPWIQFVTVTVEAGYNGLLTNTVEVTTGGNGTGASRLVIGCYAVYLPMVLRNRTLFDSSFDAPGW
ncbi:MAG: right-handed parallel beta-helix repeat-containing protein [Anaerolineae bacterium]